MLPTYLHAMQRALARAAPPTRLGPAKPFASPCHYSEPDHWGNMVMATMKQQFEQAQKDVQALAERPDNDTLLELYSFYKQATDGDASGDRPGPFEFKARAKYDAWADRKGMSRETAMQSYVKLVSHLKAK